MDLTQYEAQTEYCFLCGDLPDNLCVNTGRDFQFPDAFRKLVRVGVLHDSQGQTAQLCRCPECSSYFKWQALSQMYGSGNNDEERLIRFPPRASRLLHNFLTPEQQIPVDPAEIDEYAELLPSEMFLQVLERHVGKAPNVVTPFVPKLVSFFGRDLQPFFYNRVKSLLDAYVSDSPKRQTEVEATHAQYAFSILEKHFAHSGAILKHNGVPTNWSHFCLLFYLNANELLENDMRHAGLLTGLLAELVAFIRAFSGENFIKKLYDVLYDFHHRNWLEPFLPESAKRKISVMEEMKSEDDDYDEQLRLGQMSY